MKRLAIVGSRGFAPLSLVTDFVDRLQTTTIVVSGGARGVDREAVRAAKARALRTQEFLPNWNLHGRSAGIHRNCTMIDTVDGLMAFWDGTSRGTKHAIEYARGCGIWVRVYDRNGLFF